MPTETPTQIPDPEDWRTSTRARRVFLASKRDELQTPVHAILEIVDRILVDSRATRQEGFVRDMEKVRQAARDLRDLIQDVLSPARLMSTGDLDFEALRRRIRHEMLNKLNPVINYPEMWLEDADEEFLEGFVDDLELLNSLGRRCFALIDTILASWDIEATVESKHLDLHAIEEMVQRMSSELSPAITETGSILIVDDNGVNRDILQRLLEPLGHTISTASNGREALNVVKQGNIDLVLLDIVMPEMDGFAALMELKSDPKLRDVPVIMISALGDIEYVVSCIKMGAEDYLSRPYKPVFLKSRINACLEKKRLREREQQYIADLDRERRRSDELLHVILPGQIVVELKEKNRFTPRRYEGVAVMFADIVNFTPYCEAHSAEEVVEHLQGLVETWETAALRYEIQKIKTIGDAFMAACGLLTLVDNPVLRCIEFGREMIAATQRLSTGWDLRVGIHCGHVMAGVLGRRQYLFDLFGDTVNTAARMESHGVKGQIVLSSEASAVVEQHCLLTELDPTAVKGKGVVPRFRFDGFRPGVDRSMTTL